MIDKFCLKMLFEAKTHEGHMMKILAEVLQNSIRTASFEIYHDRITMRMIDSQRRILIDLSLEADNFNIYRLNSPEKIHIGITMSHLYKMIKSIKKNDILHLFISDDDHTKLMLKVFPKNMGGFSESFLPIQTIQSLDIPIPTGYTHPIIVSSNEFQKTLKELCSLSPHILIKMTQHRCTMVSICNDIMGKKRAFGDYEENDTEEKFSDTFISEQLNRIYKMAGLASSVKIYAECDLPLLVKTNIGSLGKLQIFIKTKSQIEQDEIHLSNGMNSQL
jgi:proliferating cell nuclear antigen PCNA